MGHSQFADRRGEDCSALLGRGPVSDIFGDRGMKITAFERFKIPESCRAKSVHRLEAVTGIDLHGEGRIFWWSDSDTTPEKYSAEAKAD